jgi:hypothetical protein
MTGSRPRRLASQGVGSASAPISTSGMLTSNDAVACESPNSSIIEGKIGPTETIPGRRAKATRTMAATASAPLVACNDRR